MQPKRLRAFQKVHYETSLWPETPGKGASMKENRDILLQQLNLKREEIEHTLKRFLQNQREHNAQITNDDLRDEFDHAQREVFFHSNSSLIEKKARELKEIDRLIQRISRDAQYGVCEECGGRIPPERLLIVPETSLCVECQRELERFAHSRKHAGRIRSALTSDRDQIRRQGFWISLRMN